MFGKLKEKLKSALSVFTKKAEEELDIKPEEKEILKEAEVKEEKKVEIQEKEEVLVEKLIKEKKNKKESSKELKKKELQKIEDKKAEEKIKEALKEDDESIEEIKFGKEGKEEPQTEMVEEPQEITEEDTEEKEEKKGFFKRLFEKKEEKREKEEKAEGITEISVPEKYNPATQKFEPDVSKIKEISEGKEELEEKKGFFGKIKQSLTTKTIFAAKFEELFWDLELALLENNVSVKVIEKIKEDLKKELVDKPLPRDVKKVIEETLQKTLKEILSCGKIDLLKLAKKKKPLIIAFFGVNGAGKTTSIAKLTYYFQQQGLSIVLAACDTFRAAAIQQLEEHADRLGVKMIKHDYGSDAAAVAFDAVKYAEKNKIDIVMIDTAGRLHSNTNLMQELEKIIHVTKPDVKLFVGESITGNDCIEQARQFNDMVEMDGTILTKADVDEKGGAPLSIAYVIKKPILFLGVGQEYKDLEEFSAEKILVRLGL